MNEMPTNASRRLGSMSNKRHILHAILDYFSSILILTAMSTAIKISLFWALICGLFLLQCPGHHCASEAEIQNHIKALRKELFQSRGYDPMARPVLNYTHPMNVSIYLDINYIKQLDVQSNVLESEGWIRLNWLDENLKWVSSEFGGLDDIRVRVDEVFRPDITIINSVESDNVVRTSTHSDLILWNTGEIFWMPAISMKTICDVDLTEWPFDKQTCVYRFASWTYDGSALNLRNTSDKIDLGSFVDNPEWNVVDSKCEYKLHIYFEGAYYPEVIYYLTIARKSTIYRYTVYLPVLCALLINLMTLFLDIRNSLRFHLSTLSFVTLLFIILYLGFKLGFGSLGTPKVIIYLGQMIVLVSITVLWSAFALNFAKSTFEVPPSLMRAIEPVQHWLVSSDIEATQLTNADLEEQAVTKQPKRAPSINNNLVVIQVIDKGLFVLFLILTLALHN